MENKLEFQKGWSYSPAPEKSDHIKIKPSYDLFINGKYTPPQEGKYFSSINPANEKKVTDFALASAEDVDRAVKAARSAYENIWSKMPSKERGKYLFRIARLLQEKVRELAILESIDGGKTIREARDIDIPLVAAHLFYNAGWSDKLSYAFPNQKPCPLGVVGQIIPWNFPLLMAAWKIAPAIATGNTVVLKPAETTSLTAMKLTEILQEAELPAGVVNIITGDGTTGTALVNHPDINKIAFTGSTDVGKLICKSIAGSGKRLTLELGGKAANIIFEDATIDQAVEGIINGIYFNQGHVCCAGSRLFVQESIKEEVLKKLYDRIETLIVGDPLDKNTDIGAINSKEQLLKIQEYIEIGKQEGAQMFQSSSPIPSKGFFISPTVFTELAQSSRLVQEEIFGPVLSVQTFRTEAEVIQKANNTRYGLSAGVWTDKGSRIFAITSQLKAGVIWANTYNKLDPTSPFGGYKESGFGREGGLDGLLPYLRLNN